MRTPSVQIASALSMFYEGMSLNAIRRHLDQAFHNLPSDSSVYEWIVKYTSKAIAADNARQTQTRTMIQELGHGPFWIANDTPVKIGKTNLWIWDIMDYWSRLLVGSFITTTRTPQDVRAVMEMAADRAGESPGLVITSKRSIYQNGVDQAFGVDTLHLQAGSSKVQPYSNTVARYHGPLKTRNKILRGLKKVEAAELIMGGWMVHYNFFRTHEALKYNTPAAVFKIDFPFRNWLDVVNSGTGLPPSPSSPG